ncbi:MAG: DinB family protein [Candidatus Thorarchaeota archaeon SMTZ1-45]|nr:MAG: hypothetical protein AM325_11380 [Candidatus Thorarchaeota archaeon SMTZ1-45]
MDSEVVRMRDIQDIQLAAKSVRVWRDMEIKLLSEAGCNDLSYRPRNGMSALGWVLAHQAAIYDFSVNMLIEQGPPMNPGLFKLYQPGTSGDWARTPLSEIQAYYDAAETNLFEWVQRATPEDFDRVIKKGTAPSFFVGMSCREVLTNAFTHLNYHTGHLTAIRKDWKKTRSDELKV